jgi:hypothetical protein
MRIDTNIVELVGNNYSEDFDELIEEYKTVTTNIIVLKTAIMAVNVENNIFIKICELGEIRAKDSEADMVLHNKALVLLSKLGIWEEHNITRIVNALMNMPYMNEGENDG